MKNFKLHVHEAEYTLHSLSQYTQDVQSLSLIS